MKIALCGSFATQQSQQELYSTGKKLETMGHTVSYPEQEDSSNYSNLSPEQIAPRKNFYMREHFPKLEQTEAILVTNGEKKGIPGYIGANTLIEMALAFYLGKKIFLLNPVDRKLPAYDEVTGMLPTVLNGKLEDLK